MSYDVFISHSQVDNESAKALARALREHGLSVFSIGDLKPGDMRSSVANALRRSGTVLVLWAPDSVASEWTNYEVGYANGLGKNAVIAKPPSFSVRDLPVDLAGWSVVDFDPSAPEVAAKSLASELLTAA